MQKLLIKGKKDLSGSISISGSKNATLPILAASILAKKVKLTNVPLVKDIFTMIEWGPFTFQHPIELPMFFLCIVFVVFMVFNLAMNEDD